MIIFFGPAGAGKSVQGQLLAARNGWRWLSAGQLLRDSKDTEMLDIMKTGKLLPHDKVNEIVGAAIKKSADIEKLVLDGFPRAEEQAKWLVESQPEHGRGIDLAIVLEVPRHELLKRLELRGRVDDVPDAIDERLKIYRQEIYPILSYFTDQNIPVVHINGEGTVGQVHDRIMEELIERKLIS